MPRPSWSTGESGRRTKIPPRACQPAQWRRSSWDRWRVAPRLSVVGTQRLLATTDVTGSLERQTLPGYATVDVNVRRNLFKTLDAFLTIENALDRRYRTINPRAYTNAEEMIGAPQNPRRLSVGFSVRVH
jgi:outer membrane receptor protein involved in Fe transport